jgi:hypothetical protein
MIDLALLLILALVAWNVAAEGAFGAAAVFLSVLFAGLISMDYFEPLANLLESLMGTDWSNRVDFIALVGLFAIFVFLLRLLSDRLVPNFIAVHARVYDVCRWGFALMAGYVTVGVLLTALHTAPLPREFLGFRPERKNLLGFLAPDRDWLGFVQYVSERSMPSSESGRIFDGSRFRLPGHANEVWPTFIIRYASRRESLGAPVEAAAPVAAAASPGAPRPAAPAPPGGL